jgi:hypothetical protein
VTEGDFNYISASKAIHASINEFVMDTEPAARLQTMNWKYNVRTTIHPLILEKQQEGIANPLDFRVG